jgi:putative transposase
LDFTHDAVACGRAIRVLSVVDLCTRECLVLEVDTSFASRRVTRVLEQIVAERGKTAGDSTRQRPELTSRHFLAWCVERKIELLHIQPGKPTQNARVETFHGRVTGRVFGRELVSKLIRCAAEDRGVAKGVRRGESAQQLGLQNPERVHG